MGPLQATPISYRQERDGGVSMGFLGASRQGGCKVLATFTLIVVTSIIMILLATPYVFRDFAYKAVYLDNSTDDSTSVQSGHFKDQSTKSPMADQSMQPAHTKKQVLLVTIGRSGSSFTSALISHNKNVFFVYEPLFVLSSTSDNLENDSVAIVKAFLSCDFPGQYLFALDNQQHRNSEATRDFYQCMASKRRGLSHVSCFLDLLGSCQSHPVTFVKTIRFKVKWAHTLLASNPDFRLLYLVRDPRATLYSQSRVFRSFSWNRDIQNVSRQHCARLEENLEDTARLRQLFPGQVLVLRYEDGALDPISYTKLIYSFLAMSYSPDLETYIDNITRSGVDLSPVFSAYSVVRKNSSQTMGRWRYSAGYLAVKEIDNNCRRLYSRLGYLPVSSQRHLESDQSLLVQPQPAGLFS